MTYTENLNLNIIEPHDLVSYQGFNENAEILDSAVGALQSAVEPIGALETAVADNAQAITGVENDVNALRTRVGNAETNISDIQVLNTQQNNRLNALEGSAQKYDLNGGAITPTMHKTFIKTGVSFSADPYNMQRCTITIPMSNFAGASNVKVIGAQLYNDGLVITGGTTGANLVRATVRDNNLECVFVSTADIAYDNGTAVIDVIAY